MEDRLSSLLAMRERVLPAPVESMMISDVIPLLASIKKDLEEVKSRLARIEEKLG
ncbi:MAG: hypothetical protein QFX33_03975 [Candidatus Nezhaarchaeota archaeon]|nr:hypothetical protein [Candidatus Nezhaarchaeota archaeon]